MLVDPRSLGAVVGLVIGIASSASAIPSFRGLGALSVATFDSRALGISADGSTVVGASTTSRGSEAFRWTGDAEMLSLGQLHVGPNGFGRPSSSSAVSADGSVVVGSSYTPFRFTEQGGLVDLGTIPGGDARFSPNGASGVSADGSVVVGSSHSEDGPEAFRWTQEGGFQRLGDLPGGNFASRAHDVSADGSIVVGDSYSELSQAVGWTEAFVWTEAAGMIGLGDLPGGVYRSSASAISGDGSTVVGASSSDLGSQAFVWTDATGMVGIGFLGEDDVASVGSATSGDGRTVGGSVSRFDGLGGISVFDGPRGISVQVASTRAFVWDRLTGMRDLHAVISGLGLDIEGWTLEGVSGISGDGMVIVGTGINPAGNTEAWIADLGDPTVTVDINIRPRSDANFVNPASRGRIPVAILGFDTFDIADVDVTTLTFGPEAAPLAHRNCPHVKDTNHDGLPDLLGHFRARETGIAFDQEEACIRGALLDGTPFEGCDAIQTVPLVRRASRWRW